VAQREIRQHQMRIQEESRSRWAALSFIKDALAHKAASKPGEKSFVYFVSQKNDKKVHYEAVSLMLTNETSSSLAEMMDGRHCLVTKKHELYVWMPP